MAVLDQVPAGEPMIVPARYLDVTLDAARDMPVAHRDPTLHMVRHTTSLGTFSVSLLTTDGDRLASALRLREGASGMSMPALDGLRAYELRDMFQDAVEFAIATAFRLDRSARSRLRHAYRLGGVWLPDPDAMADRLADLVGLYLTARGLST